MEPTTMPAIAPVERAPSFELELCVVAVVDVELVAGAGTWLNASVDVVSIDRHRAIAKYFVIGLFSEIYL